MYARIVTGGQRSNHTSAPPIAQGRPRHRADRSLTVDLPHDANCARFYETENRVRTVIRSPVKQPVNARGLGRWRTYDTELLPLIAELDAVGALAGWGG